MDRSQPKGSTNVNLSPQAVPEHHEALLGFRLHHRGRRRPNAGVLQRLQLLRGQGLRPREMRKDLREEPRVLRLPGPELLHPPLPERLRVPFPMYPERRLSIT